MGRTGVAKMSRSLDSITTPYGITLLAVMEILRLKGIISNDEFESILTNVQNNTENGLQMSKALRMSILKEEQK